MKAHIILIVVLLFSTYSSFSQVDDLSWFRWKNRVILIFGPSEHPKVKRQMKELMSNQAGINERDLVLLQITNGNVRTSIEDMAVSLDAQKVRDQFSVSPDSFRFILIGKDGGVKLQKSSFVSNEYIFSVIDAMPMRRREMRERNSND